MKRFVIATALLLALAACSSGQRGPRYDMRLKPAANPGEVIAAELAFARLAQEKGQWAAFRATAAEGAEMFVPQRVKALDWLKGRAEPAAAVQWQPHAVWSSCDGSYAVTRGGWTSSNASGSFATIWQRQGNGMLKWIADMSLTSEGPVAAPDMIAARVADCKVPPPPAPMEMLAMGADRVVGAASDGTLRWSTSVAADGSRTVSVLLWSGGTFEQVLRHTTIPAQR